MRTDEFKVVHVSPRVQARGGIEALHALNRTLPLKQVFVALFDRGSEARDDYLNLNFTWRTTLGRMRREFARALAPHAGSIVVYHNEWGLPLLCGGDGAARRLAYCLAMPAFHARDLPGSDGLVDGALGITPAMAEAWREMLPSLGAERVCVLPLPVAPPLPLQPRRECDGEVVLGYAGRVVSEHKRLDRLPEFLRALDKTGLRYRFEVLGDGSLRAKLQREVGARVRFHGWTPKDEFWRVLAGWDGIVFFTEVDGGPIAMLEAMALGVIPFFPHVEGSMGSRYAPQVDPRCLCETGNIPSLAAAVHDLLAQDQAKRAALRARARALVAGHTVEHYGRALSGLLGRVAGLPRISAAGQTGGHWSDGMPLGFATRFAPWLLWRQSFPQFLKRSLGRSNARAT